MIVSSSRLDPFGLLPNGEEVWVATLINANGTSVRLISYGAAVQSLHVADRHGVFEDIVSGYRTLDEYVTQPQFFGATVGRVANRLSNGRFTLNEIEHQVSINEGRNSLHGGQTGFDKVNWSVIGFDQANQTITLQYVSPPGDQGYPGTLTATATYSLNDNDALSIHYEAVCDASTIVNLSNHTYWNLSGDGSAYSALDHVLAIHAERILPVDQELIPTGEFRSVEGTPFDFRRPKRIGERIRDAGDEQIRYAGGYDHTWVIDVSGSGSIRPVAHLADPHSGRNMAILTNQPGLQFYSGNFFDGSTIGKSGRAYRMGDAIALEPQRFPDAPNQPRFPSIVLEPGERYSNVITWQFGVDNSESNR